MTTVPALPVQDHPSPGGEATGLVEPDLVEPDLVEDDLLVEDVSIDGMCGVY